MKQIFAAVAAVAAILALAGCESIGSPPKGMSNEDAARAIDQMKPEDKIRFISSSPLPQDEKEKRYREIEAETGVKASDVLGGGRPGGTGAGG
ncbi:MAG: hypothetical protein MH204_12110 [Fimbriimonadaceae bacterium]|nr:hypothetical protein [Fimbriimonadaceae bacterium]